jgi:hypothetical protein
VRRGQTRSPRFFVSVASKEFRVSVSGLESTHVGSCVSVDSRAVIVVGQQDGKGQRDSARVAADKHNLH